MTRLVSVLTVAMLAWSLATTTVLAQGRYEGEKRNGKPHGHGVAEFANGDRYEGNFKDGKINGYGSLMFPNGDKYKGYWQDGKRNGHGVAVLPNGDR